MLHTHLCDVLDIKHPIIQAGMGARATSAELVAAACNAGALGSLAASGRSAESLQQQIAMIRELTNHPFAVNHIVPTLDPEAFVATLEARPRVVSFAVGDPGDLVKKAHDAGSLVMHQVTNVTQAYQAAERGVDVIIAQGSESGGFGGFVATMALVPQVVDATSPVPVAAAGGIYDGRGLAAALALGAQGINIGTRFLAARESPISDFWKQAIISAQSEDVVKVEFLDDVLPPGESTYNAIPRAIRTPFIDRWFQGGDRRPDKRQLQGEMMAAMQSGTSDELVPFAGQTAGAIREILPVEEIISRIVAEAEAALRQISRLLG